MTFPIPSSLYDILFPASGPASSRPFFLFRSGSCTRLVTILSLAVLVTAGLSQGAPGQTVSHEYAPSSENFANPERGFYRHTQVQAENTGGILTTSYLQSLRTSQSITLVLRLYYLKAFRDKPLSDKQLDLMKRDFAALREAGVKAILRFAYSSSASEADAPLAVILEHLEQLTPVIQANADVIAVVQAGFIGAWGEWYYSSNNLNNTPSRRAVTRKILEVLPPSRMVQIRTPYYKQAIYERMTPLEEQEALLPTEFARTGHHNDCFLASDTDYGTYLNVTNDKAYLEKDSRYTPMGGETCNPNPPRSECEVALEELGRFHWSYLNRDYHQTVLNSWNTGGCMEEVRLRLGYRLTLLDGLFTERARPGGTFQVRLNLVNTGWAAPFNPRRVELVLREQATGRRFAALLQEDPRRWVPGDTITVEAEVGLPADAPHGVYDVLLSLPAPESSLRERPEFSIRLANADVWEPDLGVNNLHATTTVDPEAPGADHEGPLRFAPYENFVGATPPDLPDHALRFEIYPNPFRDRTHVVLRVGTTQDVRIRLVDPRGREVMRLQDTFLRAGVDHRLALETSDLAGGLYLVDVLGESFRSAQAVVLIR